MRLAASDGRRQGKFQSPLIAIRAERWGSSLLFLERNQMFVLEIAERPGDSFACRTYACGDLLMGQRHFDLRCFRGLLFPEDQCRNRRASFSWAVVDRPMVRNCSQARHIANSAAG